MVCGKVAARFGVSPEQEKPTGTADKESQPRQ